MTDGFENTFPPVTFPPQTSAAPSAPAEPIAEPPAAPPESCTDPVTTSAVSMLKLGVPKGSVNIEAQKSVEKALRYHICHIENDDFIGLKTMLMVQTQVLHRIFTQATDKYAEAKIVDNARPYAAIALKAQSYCRMTANAIKTLTEPHPSKRKKSRNELVSNAANAEMDY